MNRISACLVAVATFTVPVLPLAGSASTAYAAEKVMCHGKVATIDGNGQVGEDLIGTPGPDVIVAGSWVGNIIDGRGGNDVICGGSHDNWLIRGGPGNDLIFSGRGDDDVTGGPGADVVYSGTAPLVDFVRGGSGPDKLFGGHGSDVLSGDGGDDNIWGGGGGDELVGGEGNDVEHGGAGADRVLGDPGRDRLWGGPGGQDVIDYGRKWFWWEGGTRHHIDLTVNLERGRGSGRWFGTDRLHGFDQVWTGPGNDRVVGDHTRNTFLPGIGKDTIHGRGGIDTLRYSVPNRFDDGPEGGMLNPNVARARVDLASHFATLVTRRGEVAGRERLYGIENVIGTGGGDTIWGNGRPNVLVGGGIYDDWDGDDVIYGLRGDDTLVGRGGDDVLNGGKGNNSIQGGRGTDTCSNPATGPTVTGCEVASP